MRPFSNYVWIALATVILTACGAKTEQASEDESTAANDSTEKVYPVKTKEIITEVIPQTLNYPADLLANEEINLGPASPGRIRTVKVEVGDRVSKGQLLIEMDPTQLQQALLQYQNAKTNFERIDTLYQLGSTSEQQYEQMKVQYDIAKSSYEFLQENTNMRAPFSGVVTGKYFEDGEMYTGSPSTLAGKPAIVTLMQLNPLKAIVSVTQSYYTRIKEGMQVNITTDIIPDKTFKGYVSKVYPTIDPSTRTFKTEIMIKNPGEVLRPGMYGKFEIKLAEVDAIVVPAIAVLKQEGTNNRFVFVYKDGIAQQVAVEIGRRFDENLEIKSEDIAIGDMLIIEGQASLLNGSKVKLVD